MFLKWFLLVFGLKWHQSEKLVTTWHMFNHFIPDGMCIHISLIWFTLYRCCKWAAMAVVLPLYYSKLSGPFFNIKTVFLRYKDSYCKDKTGMSSASYFIMGIRLLTRQHLDIETALSLHWLLLSLINRLIQNKTTILILNLNAFTISRLCICHFGNLDGSLGSVSIVSRGDQGAVSI